MGLDLHRFQKLMADVYENSREGDREELSPAEYERRKRDFAFHMSDWATDLEEFVSLWKDPEGVDLEKATTFVIGFLYHVVPHLNAAGRLLLDEISDPFANDEHDPALPVGTSPESP